MNEKITRCKACAQPVRWVRMAQSGKANPLDPEPRADGNITVSESGIASYVGKRTPPLPEGTPRYVSHFATCPEAARFRRSS